ncbi:hypothetical protein [Burkholderia stagnalis]|uniref:hypothetical protein n=1 Tax=Burkholderia stagnalis TaxID=1503054 RepID=UPI000A92DAB8|nr:hypothetical protein [Burkholderia stagnalis]
MNKPKIRTTTTARVTVQLEVETGSWGPECGLDQVYRQAAQSAEGKVRAAFGAEASRMEVRAVSVDAVTTRTNLSS